jgi:glutamate/tyrosine decarboxylase-like PLP-dependent enzyme
MKAEEAENWNNVHYRMKEEGFHYCFKHYSSFKEIKDEKFHELREKYLEVAKELEQYITNKNNEANWELEYDDDEDEDEY